MVEGERERRGRQVVASLPVQPDMPLITTDGKFCAPCTFQVLLKWIFSCNHRQGIFKGGLLQANLRKFSCTVIYFSMWKRELSFVLLIKSQRSLISFALPPLFLFMFLKAEMRAKASRMPIPFKCQRIHLETGGGFPASRYTHSERSCTWRF